MSDNVKMSFGDAPIGARFLMPGTNDVWVKINSNPEGLFSSGRGLVVKWEGNIQITHQSHCCWCDDEGKYTFDTEIELV